MKSPGITIFIRGDININPNNRWRVKVWVDFLTRFNLSSLDLEHLIYHHFDSDSFKDNQLDVLVFTPDLEFLDHVIGGKYNPILLFSLSRENFVKAHRVQINCHRILWQLACFTSYSDSLANILPGLLEDFGSNAVLKGGTDCPLPTGMFCPPIE